MRMTLNGPFLLWLLVVLGCCSTRHVCWAWGTLGHEIVANVAWSRLSESTQHAVIEVLGDTNGTDDEAGSPLAAVADWADRVRHYKPWSAPLHYIDVRDDQIPGGCHYNHNSSNDPNHYDCHFVYARDCPNDVCVAGAIGNYTSQLMIASNQYNNNNMRRRRRTYDDDGDNDGLVKEALMFLTHFIGDIHQPLHCSRTTDKGGNDFHVHFAFNVSLAPQRKPYRSAPQRRNSLSSSHHGWNLHSVWDTGIIEVALHRDYNGSRAAMEQDLIQQYNNSTNNNQYLECPLGNNQTCTELWGAESFQTALEWAYLTADSLEVENGSTLTEAYYESRLPIVKERLVAAGVRLAATLEDVFQPKSTTTTLYGSIVPSLRMEFATRGR